MNVAQVGNVSVASGVSAKSAASNKSSTSNRSGTSKRSGTSDCSGGSGSRIEGHYKVGTLPYVQLGGGCRTSQLYLVMCSFLCSFYVVVCMHCYDSSMFHSMIYTWK